jgi:hypothetical protein
MLVGDPGCAGQSKSPKLPLIPQLENNRSQNIFRTVFVILQNN